MAIKTATKPPIPVLNAGMTHPSNTTDDVVKALSALAQESRLSVFRLLGKRGPEGFTPGVIAQKHDIAPPTLSFHLKELQNAGIENPDGSFVTTVPTAGGPPRVVSYTSPLGLTATEAGYVSPVLLHHFLDSLFQSLASTQGEPASNDARSTANGSFQQSAGATVAPLSAYRNDVSSKVNHLIQQLSANTLPQSSLAGLQSAFDQLMQGSGIDSNAPATTMPDGGRIALRDFLISALPSIVDGSVTLSGIRIDTTA